MLALNNLKMEVKSETSDDSSSGSSSPTSSNSSSDSDEEEDDVCDSDLDAEEEVDQEVELGGDSGLKDLIFTQEKVPPDASYIGDWTGAPSIGSSGFNRFAARVMWNAGIGKPKKKATVHQCSHIRRQWRSFCIRNHPSHDC